MSVTINTIGALIIWRAIGPRGSYVGIIHGKKQSVVRHWKAYCEGRNTPPRLVTAFKTYGIEAFEIEILEEVFDYVALRQQEQYWVKHFDSFNNGYNGNKGGACWKDPESPRVAALRRWRNPEFKEQRRKETAELWKDPKYRAAATKIRSEIAKKRWQSEEYREKVKIAQEKYWSDPANIRKHSIRASIAGAKLWKDPVFRKKAMIGIKNRVYSK